MDGDRHSLSSGGWNVIFGRTRRSRRRTARGCSSSSEYMLQRLGFLLHLCAKSGALSRGLCLHGALIKRGLDSDVFLSNHLINLYARCGRISVARQVFEVMRERNLISWSLIISGCDKAGQASAALEIFSNMPFLPNEYVYAGAISACAHLSALWEGRQVHAFSFKTGHAAISFVCNSLISLYMKCGRSDDALVIFSGMPAPNLVSFNAMIAGFADDLQFQRSLDLFKVMNQRGLRADQFSLVGVLGALAGAGDLQSAGGTSLHCMALKLGLDRSAFAGNAVLAMYSRSGSIREAERVFQLIEDKDAVSCNTFMAACSRCGDHAKALFVFRAMAEGHGAEPDSFTLAGALGASAGLASAHHGGEIHCHLLRSGAPMDAAVCNALMNMYAKCGRIGCAESLFRLLPERNLISWNTMIAGLGSHGRGSQALQLFEEMQAAGVPPDSCSFSGLLAACSHSGMVEEGLALFDSMEEEHGITPGPEHLSSMVDLLGRAGRLKEAEDYLKASSFSEDHVAWGSLLASCRLHGELAVGRRVAERLLELRPPSSSPYVLLSSLYAVAGRWGRPPA
ncbi:unnamed protein product [Spirodela intermedia]|uniref:Uncharacterized protein n=1 Tax=Spirodela intermedia TaxID=51605 RepID=A0A7I8J3B5_SPIIN|nr:unnamed protein product [Spirodela intermedia]CAA6664462.1 unnamed protein product [Spirodela intermedia]